MFSKNTLAVAAVGVACVLAAGGGSYLATRHNATSPVDPVSLSAAGPAPSLPSAVAAVPVQETEALVGDTAKPSPKPAPPVAAPPRRATAPVRPAPRQAKSPASVTARNDSQPPVLDRTWPNSATAPVPPMDGLSNGAADPAGREELPPAEIARSIEPPQPTYQELVVSTNSVIGLRTQGRLSSERAKVEDRVDAEVARDVRVNGQVAIPAGTRALGSVTVVERGGKFKEQAKLGIRFHTLVMADGSRLPITTDTVYRFGDAPGNGSAARIGGGAVVGTILGAIIGGGKGAAIGAATGAGAGTAAAASGDRSEATFPAGVEVTARILSPVTVTLEK
jgi:hypothetical protein